MASQSVQDGCPELEMCFSRAELDSRPGEARLVVQGATPDQIKRVFGQPGSR